MTIKTKKGGRRHKSQKIPYPYTGVAKTSVLKGDDIVFVLVRESNNHKVSHLLPQFGNKVHFY